MSNKAQTTYTFIRFKNYFENYTDYGIKCVQSDWGGEFRLLEFYLETQGTGFKHSCPYSSHQNGRTEWKHRHIIETASTLLAQAKLPLKIWWEPCKTTIYLINTLSSSVLKNQTSYDKLLHQESDCSFLKIFECACYPHLTPYNNHKLQFRPSNCIFIIIITIVDIKEPIYK